MFSSKMEEVINTLDTAPKRFYKTSQILLCELKNYFSIVDIFLKLSCIVQQYLVDKHVFIKNVTNNQVFFKVIFIIFILPYIVTENANRTMKQREGNKNSPKSLHQTSSQEKRFSSCSQKHNFLFIKDQPLFCVIYETLSTFLPV